MMTNIIEIKDLSKIYERGCDKVIALNSINLIIKSGEFVAIVGTSGSGKSTLMNILGCLDSQTTGSYKLNGIEVNQISDNTLSGIRNREIGFIFQGFNLIQSLNAVENVELPLLYSKVSSKQRKKIAVNTLTGVGLGQRLYHMPCEMSGGQQQRVAIARAIITTPPIILADEPTGNLDCDSSKSIIDILVSLNKEGKTIILITHDLELAKIADKIVKISDGKIED